jgi:hypothetical protein
VATAAFLDWAQVPPPGTPTPTAATQAPLPPPALCTRAEHGRAYRLQAWSSCADCYPDAPDHGVCAACAAACHRGHRLGPSQTTRFRCDCGDPHPSCTVAAPLPPVLPLAEGGDGGGGRPLPVPAGTADVLLGAEITYNTLSITALANTVEALLAPDGIFYEVLSDDRDGAVAFVEEMAGRGFRVARRPADRGYLGAYATRTWAHQETETYTFYTFARPATRHPLMGSRIAEPWPAP